MPRVQVGLSLLNYPVKLENVKLLFITNAGF